MVSCAGRNLAADKKSESGNCLLKQAPLQRKHMISAPDLELIAKHSADEATFLGNQATLLALPAATQAAVVQRLRVLDRYLGVAEPTAADAAQMAQALGMSERNFYRLVGKLRDHGPVAGLAPNFRVRQRPSAAADGLGEVAETALERLLQANEDARWKDVVDEVLSTCRLAGLEPPSSAAIRRRLLALRAEGRLREAGEKIFGETWLMDQTAISLTVQNGEAVRYAVVTLLIDRQTKLIAGAGLLSEENAESGVVSALADAWSRVPRFAAADLNVASKIREFHWVLPENVSGSGFMLMRGITQKSGLGPRRHGEAIFRLLGNRLGPYTLLIRSTAAPGDIDDQLVTAPITFEKAEELVRHTVGTWNDGILEQVSAVKAGRGRTARRRRLIQLLKQMTDTFLPALSSPSASLIKDIQSNIAHPTSTAGSEQASK
jgi:hypothetical protein